ncbi:hypothetical protein [Salinifilum ghardaiensis]
MTNFPSELLVLQAVSLALVLAAVVPDAVAGRPSLLPDAVRWVVIALGALGCAVNVVELVRRGRRGT